MKTLLLYGEVYEGGREGVAYRRDTDMDEVVDLSSVAWLWRRLERGDRVEVSSDIDIEQDIADMVECYPLSTEEQRDAARLIDAANSGDPVGDPDAEPCAATLAFVEECQS